MKLYKDTIIHRWARVPYRLHTQVVQAPAKPRARVLLIHGIGVSSLAWDKVVAKLPADVHVTTVDLLGFGLSPRPTWAQYDAKRQARSILSSCGLLRRGRPVIVVGHSLGALVAVELAKMRPRHVSSLVLCSAPFYAPSGDTVKKVPTGDDILKRLYRTIQARPDQFVKISAVAAKYGIINRAFQVTDENVHAYMGALEASIVNQTALADIQVLRQPIQLLYGTLDPVVVTKRLKSLEKTMPNVRTKSVIAAHEIKGPYVSAAARAIVAAIGEDSLSSVVR